MPNGASINRNISIPYVISGNQIFGLDSGYHRTRLSARFADSEITITEDVDGGHIISKINRVSQGFSRTTSGFVVAAFLGECHITEPENPLPKKF
jgi:hypothetical protein